MYDGQCRDDVVPHSSIMFGLQMLFSMHTTEALRKSFDALTAS
jgi:hypothetical protein